LAPVTKWLIIVNLIVFFVPVLLREVISPEQVIRWGSFSVDTMTGGQLWRLLTFQFIHDYGNGAHIFFNMVGLFFFGRYLEGGLGSRRYVGLYLLSGFAGALFFALLYLLDFFPTLSALTPLIGASAGVYGVMLAVSVFNPDQRVLLFFAIPVRLKYVIYVIIGVALAKVLFQRMDPMSNAGGEAGHLGGILTGWLLAKNSRWLGWLDRKEIRQSYKRRKQREGGRRKQEPKIRPRTTVPLHDSEVDRILDKISEHGIHTLTDKEREILTRASKKDDD